MLEETNTKTQEKVTHFNQKTTKQTTAAHVEIDQPLKKMNYKSSFSLRGVFLTDILLNLHNLKPKIMTLGV